MKDFYTIVIADDEEQLRHSLIRRIPWEEIGFQVVGEAENGIEALEQVERLEPDLSADRYPDAVYERHRAGAGGEGDLSDDADCVPERAR